MVSNGVVQCGSNAESSRSNQACSIPRYKGGQFDEGALTHSSIVGKGEGKGMAALCMYVV